MRLTIATAAAFAVLTACTDTVHLTLDTPTPTPTPSQPTGFVTSAGNGYVKLDWNPNPTNEGVTSYSIYEATTQWTTWNNTLPGAVVTTAISCCTLTRTGLANETTYWYGVVAQNAASEGPVSSVEPARPPGWRGTLQYGDTLTDYPSAIATDAAGNTYVAGSTDGDLLGNTNQGSMDAFVSKFNISGAHVWTKQIGSSSNDYGMGVDVDANGFVFLTGYTTGSLDGTNQGMSDIFVSRISPTGSLDWTTQAGSTLNDYGSHVLADGTGGAFVSGSTFGDLGGTQQGAGDLVLLKVNGSGGVVINQHLGSTGSESSEYGGIGKDGTGNIYVAATTSGDLDGNTNSGGTDIVLVKWSSAGTRLFTKQRGSSADDYAIGLDATANGQIFVSVRTLGGLDGYMNAGMDDIAVMRFDTDGNKLWTTQLGTAESDTPGGIAADAFSVRVTGRSYGVLAGSSSFGLVDIVVVSLDLTSGAENWRRQHGQASGDIGVDIACGPAGSSLVVAATDGDLVGGSNSGAFDVAVLKYSVDGALQ